MITTLDTDHPITATVQAADLLDIEPDTGTGRGPVRIVDDLEDACDEAAEQQTDIYRLVICTSDDIAQVGAEALAEHFALHSDRMIVLGECPLGPTATLAADGNPRSRDGQHADTEATGQADDDAGDTEPALRRTDQQPPRSTPSPKQQ
jgi:hypothetical protein